MEEQKVGEGENRVLVRQVGKEWWIDNWIREGLGFGRGRVATMSVRNLGWIY